MTIDSALRDGVSVLTFLLDLSSPTTANIKLEVIGLHSLTAPGGISSVVADLFTIVATGGIP